MKENSMKKSDDFELADEYDFSHGVRGRFYQPSKKATTIRLDDDVILYFKKIAGIKKTGYQTLMNSVLREYAEKQMQLTLCDSDKE